MPKVSRRLAALSATLLLLVASSCSSDEADVTATPGLTRLATTATTPRPALTPVTTPPAVDLTDPPPDVFTSDGLAQLTEAFEIELDLLVARDAPGLRDRMPARCQEQVTVEHVERDVEFLGYGLPALWRSELSELVPTRQQGINVLFSFTLVHQDDPSIIVSTTASDLPGQMRWEAGKWRTNCARLYPGARVPPVTGCPSGPR